MNSLTESEAREKWCPFARAPFVPDAAIISPGPGDVIAANRTETDVPVGRCVASSCMAWRWSAKQPHTVGYAPDGNPNPGQDASGSCGLAGSP